MWAWLLYTYTVCGHGCYIHIQYVVAVIYIIQYVGMAVIYMIQYVGMAVIDIIQYVGMDAIYIMQYANMNVMSDSMYISKSNQLKVRPFRLLGDVHTQYLKKLPGMPHVIFEAGNQFTYFITLFLHFLKMPYQNTAFFPEVIESENDHLIG